MKNRIVRSILAAAVAMALVLTSCQPATPAETEGQAVKGKVVEKETLSEKEEVTVTTKEEEKGPEMVRDSLGRMVEKPQYGGVLTYIPRVWTFTFDEAFAYPWYAGTQRLTNEELLVADWKQGPAGSGKVNYFYNAFQPGEGDEVGHLAENWEWVDDQTLVFHIREGVYFHNKPPTNGREMDANDVVFSINRMFELPSYTAKTVPPPESVTATDKWTVVVKAAPGKAGETLEAVAEMVVIVPHEAVEQYGDLQDWKNAVGTGPFLLLDYVEGSSATFERNPNYWGNDPLHPENSLPYLDGVKWLFIVDKSTQLTALRTGKVSIVRYLNRDDAVAIRQTSPQLKESSSLATGFPQIYMRTDLPPYNDIRVRQALFMAIDRQAIKDDFYGGEADILAFPLSSVGPYRDIYIPVEELPESARMLYEYDPDRARQLLTEAGYPNGFKTEIVCSETYVQRYEIVKEYWRALGVNLDIVVMETAALGAYVRTGQHQHMTEGTDTFDYPWRFYQLEPGNSSNRSMVDDPRVAEVGKIVSENYFNEEYRRQVYKEFYPYMLSQAWILQLPNPFEYAFWWPYVKGYGGEWSVGYHNMENWNTWVWMDTEMMEEMTGRK